MKILELFSGTQSVGKVFRKAVHNVLSIELNPIFESEPWNLDQWTIDILNVNVADTLSRLGRPDVIWASPMCTTHSIAAISHHRYKGEDGFLYAKSDTAKKHDFILSHTLNLIKDLKPRYFFIENPRGGMRKSNLMQYLNKYRKTVTYCQYGDSRMKPTDIWTNCDLWIPRPMCKNGSPCHESAPRGSRTGTQGLKGNLERSVIPQELCEEILLAIQP